MPDESSVIQARFLASGAAYLALLALAACGDTTEERAATGAVMGGPGGAAVGAAVGAATDIAVGKALDESADERAGGKED